MAERSTGRYVGSGFIALKKGANGKAGAARQGARPRPRVRSGGDAADRPYEALRGEEDLRHASLRDFREEVGNEAAWAVSASLKMGKGNENASRRFRIDISHQRGLASANSRFLFRAVAARIAGDRVELTGKAQYDPNAGRLFEGFGQHG